MGAKRGFFFLVTLLTVVMVALPMLYTGSLVDRGHDTSPPDTKITAGPSGYVSWSFAVLTDLHIGYDIADYDGPGYNDSGTPVSGVAAGYAQDAVNEINKIAGFQNIAFVAVLGDLTEAAEASELRAAKQILDNLAVPWIPVIGNHDTWPHTHTADGGLGELAPACCPPPDSYFNSIMGPQYANLATEMSGWGKESPALVYDPEVGRDAYFENFFFDYGAFHFVCLDFNKDGYRAGDLHDFAGGTWSWFKEHMEQFVQQNPERSGDVILLAHHPMTGDGSDDGSMTFSSAELDEISNFTNNTYYSYLDSSGITQTRPYGSRIWGQLAGHTHPWKLQVDHPTWSNGGPVIAYPRNFGGVRIGIVKVTSDTPAGVDYSGPMVATEAATNVSPISATLNGYLASLGTSSSVQVSFEWGTTTSYGFETTPQSMSGPGSFSFNLTGLTDKTTYHFRAKAVGAGTTPGSDMTFTASTVPLTVITNDATNLATTSATLNGNLAVLGTATSVNVSFEWGLTTSYGNVTTPEARTATGTFSANLTGLTANTPYHYRAKADGDGTTYGSDVTFTTDPISAPAVTSNPATSITTTSATLNGNLAALGTATSVVVSFEWGTATGSYTQTTDGQTLTATGAFSDELNGLTPGTTYYYRAKADGDGSDEGDEIRFTTATIPPSVTTGAATSLATTSATLNGNLAALGTAASVVVSFEWGTATGSYTQTTDSETLTATAAFSDELNGLTPGTTYCYRAKADGDGDPVYGLEESFATSIAQPSVSTNGVSNLATTSATLNGDLAALGTADNVRLSFEWGTTTSYGFETTLGSISAIGTFSATLTGLGTQTTYHFRAKAVGDGSAVYGDDMTFTTASLAAPSAPVISLVNSTNITSTGATITWTTNEAATSLVEFGLTEEYGSSATLGQNAVNSHSVDLTDLKPGKPYHYRVISKDDSNNQAVSADGTFTTAKSSGGMPAWAWVLIGLAVVGVLGGAAYSISTKTAKK